MPIKIEFEANGKKIRDENVQPRILKALEQAAIETVQLLKIEKSVPVDQSILKGSFTHVVFPQMMRSVAGSPVIHGEVQSRGRRAGKRMPPKRNIESWIIRKGILQKRVKDVIRSAKDAGKKVPKGFTSGAVSGKGRGALATKLRALRAGKGTRAGATKISKELDSLSFVIRRSIARDGIEGKNFYLTVARKMRPRFKKLQADAIAG